jgi:hypothetical protein
MADLHDGKRALSVGTPQPTASNVQALADFLWGEKLLFLCGGHQISFHGQAGTDNPNHGITCPPALLWEGIS